MARSESDGIESRPARESRIVRFSRWVAALAAIATFSVTLWLIAPALLDDSNRRSGLQGIIEVIIVLGILLGITFAQAFAARPLSRKPEFLLAGATGALLTFGVLAVFFAIPFWVAGLISAVAWAGTQREGGPRVATQILVALGSGALLIAVTLTYESLTR
jgi:hypothetical protein